MSASQHAQKASTPRGARFDSFSLSQGPSPQQELHKCSQSSPHTVAYWINSTELTVGTFPTPLELYACLIFQWLLSASSAGSVDPGCKTSPSHMTPVPLLDAMQLQLPHALATLRAEPGTGWTPAELNHRAQPYSSCQCSGRCIVFIWMCGMGVSAIPGYYACQMLSLQSAKEELPFL
jgi:hypothetical protein